MNKIESKNTPTSTDSLLKIRGRTLIFGDTIFQISNIAVVGVAKIVTPFPWASLIFLGVSLFSFYTQYQLSASSRFRTNEIGEYGIVGFVTGVIFVVWFMGWLSDSQKTGLHIITNAGEVGSILIVSGQTEFLRQVALTLRNIMDSEYEDINATIHIHQRNITIEGVNNANIAVDSQVSGNIVNAIS